MAYYIFDPYNVNISYCVKKRHQPNEGRLLSAMKKTDAYLKFRDCILTGRLRPGQFVTQKELCEMMDVPIAPAREAIQRLEHETLLKVYPKRGIQISDVSPRLIRNAYQVRILIEKEALRIFIEDAPIADIRALLENSKEVLKSMENKSLTVEDANNLDAVDLAFHNTIIEYLDNEILSQTYQINQARIRLIRLGNRETGDRKVPAMREHIGVLKACTERDTTTATLLLEQHLQLSQRRALDGC
jgi:DNA-binding GntR family transcriptional regulator